MVFLAPNICCHDANRPAPDRPSWGPLSLAFGKRPFSTRFANDYQLIRAASHSHPAPVKVSWVSQSLRPRTVLGLPAPCLAAAAPQRSAGLRSEGPPPRNCGNDDKPPPRTSQGFIRELAGNNSPVPRCQDVNTHWSIADALLNAWKGLCHFHALRAEGEFCDRKAFRWKEFETPTFFSSTATEVWSGAVMDLCFTLTSGWALPYVLWWIGRFNELLQAIK